MSSLARVYSVPGAGRAKVAIAVDWRLLSQTATACSRTPVTIEKPVGFWTVLLPASAIVAAAIAGRPCGAV